MRRKLVFLTAAAMLLSGCAADPNAVQTAAMQEPYSIVFAIPADTVLETFSDPSELRRYVQVDGEYEITTESVAGARAEELIASLTGRGARAQTVTHTERFGMPMYQFAWYTADDNRMHRAAILEDTDYAYLLTFAVAAEKAPQYADRAAGIFSSFGLYLNEWV